MKEVDLAVTISVKKHVIADAEVKTEITEVVEVIKMDEDKFWGLL